MFPRSNTNANTMPTEGQVADGNYRYVQGGLVHTPSAGAIYSGGQWLTPAQYQQHQAQQTTQKVLSTASNKLNTLLQNPESVASTPTKSGFKAATSASYSARA